MKTVRMKRGELYADIYDSPETIAQAKSEGFFLVIEPAKSENGTTEEKEVVIDKEKEEEKKVEKTVTHRGTTRKRT